MTARAVSPGIAGEIAGGIAGDHGEAPIYFDAILRPNRSLSRRGFAILMGAVGTVGLAVGIVFLLSGAWPVFGLYGLDIAILYWAFRVNYRDGGLTEQIRLTAERLTIERRDPSGNRSHCTFQPYWLTVTIDDPPEHHSQIVLSSHGQSVTVGAFLSPDERLDFAKALRRALDRIRHPASLTENPPVRSQEPGWPGPGESEK